MKKPLILVTNDDGITANGIRALVEVAQTIGTPIVVAPDSPQSGMGHAITIHSPIRLRQENQASIMVLMLPLIFCIQVRCQRQWKVL